MMNNKICIAITFVFILYNNSNGKSIITNNKGLNLKAQTENAELLKKSLEESFALNLKEAYLVKDCVEKILEKDFASDFLKVKKANMCRDSINKKLIAVDSYRSFLRERPKYFTFQKEGKDIRIKLSPSDGRIEYDETNNSQDDLMEKKPKEDKPTIRSLANVRLSLSPDRMDYWKLEGNKIIDISIGYYYIKKEAEEGSLVERKSEFYSNGKLQRTGEIKYEDNIRHVGGMSIGAWYLFDEKGALIETTEYAYDDSLFKFTREDVIAYLKKVFPEYSILNVSQFPQTTVNGKITQKARWWIVIRRGISNTLYIALDGKTGEKLHQSFNNDLPK